MSRFGKKLATPVLITGLVLKSMVTASACAVCFGRSDAALAKGMNMGILSHRHGKVVKFDKQKMSIVM